MTEIAPARAFAAAALCLAISAQGASSQLVTSPGIGQDAEDRLRVEQVLGHEPTDGFLLRRQGSDLAGEWARLPFSGGGAPEAGTGGERRSAPAWAAVAPEVALAWNSDLPEGWNDGLLWAGRGTSARVRGGVALRWGPARLVLAPEVAYSQNVGFEVFPTADATRSGFASPFYDGYDSADLPLRFGTRSFVVFHPGQSTLSVGAGPVRIGASTANQWWGPGIRSALLLSTHAPGFFHLFLETARPLESPIGAFEARWMVGSLVESPYFDSIESNDLRSLSGLVFTLRPAGLETLTLGFGRTVLARMRGLDDLPGHSFDVFFDWDGIPEPPEIPDTDGIYSLFARWIHPDAGVEVYGEWAHHDLPSSAREALTAPQKAHAWTVGLQWVEELDDARERVRLQGEFTTLEQTRIVPDQAGPFSYYTGRAAVQGFTHRGQVLGAALGPGGSGQWLAGDYLSDRWSAGGFLGRVRRNNDALYRQPHQTFFQHDVTLWWGARGGLRVADYWLAGLLSVGKRFNYLFQNGINRPLGIRTVDIWNVRTELGVRMEVGR